MAGSKKFKVVEYEIYELVIKWYCFDLNLSKKVVLFEWEFKSKWFFNVISFLKVAEPTDEMFFILS